MNRIAGAGLLLLLLGGGCRSASGPPRETVEGIARNLFERAVKGEDVQVRIPLTGQGRAAPKLVEVEVRPRSSANVEGREVFEYNVRLEYLNRIEQLESAAFLVRLEQRDGAWQTSFPEAPAR
jgi:hypothetical protein